MGSSDRNVLTAFTSPTFSIELAPMHHGTSAGARSRGTRPARPARYGQAYMPNRVKQTILL